MPKISARTLEEHRAETTDRLLDAFSHLIMEKGYSGVSLADVAARAGLARTAIYNYYADQEALLFAWTEREVRRTLAILETEIAAADSHAEKLRAFVRMQLTDFATRHLPPGQEVIQFLRPDTYGRFMDHIRPVEDALRRILKEGASDGEFTSDDPDSTIPMIMACIGAERAPLAAGRHTVEDATVRVTEFLLRALAPSSPAAPAKPARKRAPKPQD